MKYLIICFLVFAGLFALAFSADCYAYGHGFNKGETYTPPGECVGYTCGRTGSIDVKHCLLLATRRCRFTKVDMSKPYPRCCSKC